MRFFLFLLLFPACVFAHDGQYSVSVDDNGQVVQETLMVSITTNPADQGLPGLYYAALRSVNDGRIAINAHGSWKLLEGGVPEPVAAENALSPGISLIVFSFQNATAWGAQPWSPAIYGVHPNGPMCQQLIGNGFTGTIELYVGYGALQPNDARQIERIAAIGKNLDPEQMKYTFIFNDGRRGNKYSMVMQFTCNDPAAGA